MEGIRYSTKEMCYFVSLYHAKQILLQFALQQTKCKYMYMYVVNHHKKLGSKVKLQFTVWGKSFWVKWLTHYKHLLNANKGD